MSLFVGLLTGLSAIILKNLIHFVEVKLLKWVTIDDISLWYLVYPMIGIFLTVLFVRFVIKDNIGHGVAKILFSISRNKSELKPHNSWSPLIASSLTIGLGGSVGAEAPIVLSGASIGSNLARNFKLNHHHITLMVGCGAAGSIAGIFNAPIAGIVFTLEVLMLDLTMAYLIPLLISAAVATSVTSIFMSSDIVMKYANPVPFQVANLGYFILLGIFIGFLGLYFTRTAMFLESLYNKINSWFLRLILGGTILGLLIFLFPPLWGEGYTSILAIFNNFGTSLLNNSIFFHWKDDPYLILVFLFAILLLKVFAMASTTGSGGIGGIFAPTLFLGAVGGYFFIKAMNTFYSLGLPEDKFALAGMAGMMAAVMHAPLTGIFLTAEITGGYGMIVPLIVTSIVSYITMMRFEPHSVYTMHLAKRGELITHHKDKAVLRLMDLKQLIETDFEILSPTATLKDLVKAITKSDRNLFPVVDSDGNLKGMVKLSEVKNLIFEPGLYDEVKMKDLMYMPKFFISPYDSMEVVAEKFESSGHYNLAVIDDGKYLGFISRAIVFSNYRKTLKNYSNE